MSYHFLLYFRLWRCDSMELILFMQKFQDTGKVLLLNILVDVKTVNGIHLSAESVLRKMTLNSSLYSSNKSF